MSTFLKSIIFTMTLIGATSVYADSSMPTFGDYAVSAQDIFTGKPAPVDLTSYKGASTYKTKLTQGAQKGPNYAGHYTIVTFGCGTECQDNWLIDAKTGKIWDRFQSMIGISYTKDSSLLIVNPKDDSLLKSYQTDPDAPFWSQIQAIYKIWKNDRFEIIKQMKWVDFSDSTSAIGSSQPNSVPTTGNQQ